MSTHLLFITFLVASATVFALFEIQIEGAAGWARSLPTWRIDNRWTRRLFGARAVTGYHVYLQLFLFVILHLPYGLGLVPPSVGAELRIVAFLLLFWVVEDFLWFVFNPAFGIGAFRAERIPWHAETWWWFMPRDYWIFMPAAIGAYIASWSV